MRIHVKLLNGEELEFSIQKTSFVVGRSSQADIIIPHEGMSRKHCLIEYKGAGQIFITDLDSINGVFIDEQKIEPGKPTLFPVYLNLSFGIVQSFQIDLEDMAEVPQSPSTPIDPKLELTSTKNLQKESPRPQAARTPKPKLVKYKSSGPDFKKIFLIIAGVIALLVIYKVMA